MLVPVKLWTGSITLDADVCPAVNLQPMSVRDTALMQH